MKFQMVFEGVDRASRIMNKLMAAESKMAKATSAGSAAAEKASRAAAAATAGHTGSLTKLQAAAQKAFAMVKAGADSAGRATQALHRQTIALGKAGATQIGKGAGKAMTGLTVAAAGAVSAVGVASLVAGRLIGVASKFEKFQTILETTEGSSAKARSAMGWVTDFTAKTPYELDQVMESFVALRTRGMDPTTGLMQTLGDTSAAMGTPLMQAVEMMADAITGENERLKAFGITAEKTGDKIFYNYTNKAGKQMRASVKATDRLGIQAKLMSIFAEKYGGAMDKLSMTWDGMVSNMADLWSGFQLSIMNAGLFDWMKGKLAGVLETVNRLKDTGQLDVWAKTISDRIVMVLDNAWKFGQGVWKIMEKLGGYLQTAATYVGGWERLAAVLAGMAFAPILISTAAGLVQIALGLSMLTAALMANPITLAIAAIVAGAALIYVNWEPIKAFFVGVWTSISNAATNAWNTVKGWIGFDPMPVLSKLWDAHKLLAAMGVEALRGLVEGAWNNIKAVMEWSPVETISRLWAGLSTAATAAVESVFAAVDAVWSRVKALFEWSPVEAVQKSWAGISDALGGLIDGAAARAGAAWEKVKSVLSFSGGSDEAAVPATMTDAIALRENATVAMQKLAELDAATAKLLPTITDAVGQARNYLAGISFFDQGAALMDTMAAGMRARAAVVVEEIQRMTQTIRDHLPSSPAKIGPLSDIHRLKFGETIAGSIRAEPMVKAMRAATAATMAAAAFTAPNVATASTGADTARVQVANVAARTAATAGSASAQQAAPPSVVYSPTINLNGASEADKREFGKLLQEHAREIARLMDEQNRLRTRSSV